MPATLSGRVLMRLAQAEACEVNPHYCDDLRIARLTVHYAATGEAVLCTPDVLASYMVLGLHPSKIWSAIEARREALGWREEVRDAARKKPPQSVKLWCENTNGARAANSHAAMQYGSPRTTISVPMAAPSIAALYPNPDAPSSAKKRGFTYDEMLAIVQYSGAEHSVRAGTLAALRARGPWPKEDGSATGVICVSLIGMTIEGVCCRSTARYRARQAVKRGYWRPLRDANSWSNCPKCSAKRRTGTCDKCGYRGRARTPEGKANFDEFCRPFMYEIDIEKFRSAPRPREIRHFDARTYQEYKAAAKRGEHPNVTEMPSRKPAQPDPQPPAPPPATVAPVKQPAAEHAHRGTVPPQPKPVQPKLTRREAAKLIADVAQTMKGHTRHTESLGGYGYDLDPSDPRYRPKMTGREALEAVCARWKREVDTVAEALKFWGYQLQE